MSTFILAIPCLITSNLPRLTFQFLCDIALTSSDLASITNHIHNWVFFLLWLPPFFHSGVISPLISWGILCTYQHGKLIFQYPIFLPFHHHNHRKLASLITWTTALSNSVKLSHSVWGHPRQLGHGREVWQNVVHWKREWQTTSVFLPWEPHEQHGIRIINNSYKLLFMWKASYQGLQMHWRV